MSTFAVILFTYSWPHIRTLEKCEKGWQRSLAGVHRSLLTGRNGCASTNQQCLCEELGREGQHRPKLFGKGQHKNSWRSLRVWKDKANKGEAKEETKSQAEGDNPAQHRYEECLQSINSLLRPTDRVLAVMRWSSVWTSVWMARQGCTSAVWHKTRWGGWEDSKAPSAGQVMWGRDRYHERHWWGGLGARTGGC